MKIYVDKKEESLIEDSLYADNTRLISEFNHEESELEYDDCELIDIGIHDRQVREEVVDEIMKQLKDMDFLANDTELGERFSCYSKHKVLDILLKVERNQVKGESNVKD